MKLLLDENLSPRLVPRLRSLFALLTHVRDVGLREAGDHVIWEWAKSNGYTIVTADADFILLNQRFGFPPRVIHIEQCNFPFRIVEDLLRRNAIHISEFYKDATSGLLVIRVNTEQA